jgi:capsular exopolysaccharide synthesis family protein
MELAQPQHEAAAQSNIYRIAWQRKSLLILGLVLGVVIGLLYYSNKEPAYQSSALVAIHRKNPAVYNPNDRRDMFNNSDDYVAYHATLIRTPEILKHVASDPEVRKLESFANKSPSDILNALMTGMIINRDTRDQNTRNPILQITFKGPQPGDCQAIIHNVIKHYKDYLKDQNAKSGSELLAKIKQAENTMKNEYADLAKKHANFREMNQAIFNSKDGKNPMWSKLEMLESERLKHMRDKMDVESRLVALDKGIKAGMSLGLLYLLPSSSLMRPGDSNHAMPAVNTSERLMNLQILEKETAQRVGKNHPDFKAIQMQIEALQDHLKQQTSSMKEKAANPSLELDRQSPIQAMMHAFSLEVERHKSQIDKLDVEIQTEKQKIKEMGQLVVQDEEYDARKKMMQAILLSLAEQINSGKLNKDDPAFEAQTIQDPTMAVKVEPRLFVIMVLSTIMGLLGGFGLAYLADMTDKSFRSPDEIRRRLNIPVVGHVPMLISEEEAAKLEGAINGPDPILVTYYRPKSRKAEVFRGIRTALYFNTRGEGHKVIQITSPNMGDGKTTLSSNLAVSIAQSGKQTILIDADFRRPRLHKIFAVPSEKGFASVIMGQCEIRDAVQPTVVPGLSVLPCGPIPPNPAELLTSPRFKELLDELREQYDYVIIDTPPLLVVTDPCVVAPRVDGVLLTMRVVKNGRPIAERARDILVSLGAKPLGIVVNGVSMHGPGGYGMGMGYGYGYGYGQYDYSQAYQYKYEYSDRYYSGYGDEGYYSDRDPTEVTPPIPRDAAPINNRLPSEPTEATK